MKKTGKTDFPIEAILAVSGGADSVYLLDNYRKGSRRILVGHFDHAARGSASERDRRFVETLCSKWGVSIEVGESRTGGPNTHSRSSGRTPPGFEEKARTMRYAFLRNLMARWNAGKIIVAHTADDQIETVLMRILEGAGIAGLKGIPRRTREGVERPILDVWREDILKYVKKHRIPYRVDRSNFDTRFERNWIRQILIPLLEKRYGKSIKKRLFALGERFREIDLFLEDMARKWIGRNIRLEKPAKGKAGGDTPFRFRRKPFGKLPSELRIRILQILCFEKAQVSPNERLLRSMDRMLLSGGPSAGLAIGRGSTLSCRYENARWTPARSGSRIRIEQPVRMEKPGRYELGRTAIRWEEKRGGMRPSTIRKGTAGEKAALFDAAEIRLPLTVRPLRYGDRIRPFGMEAEKKVKEILIERKIPREERWGRPVVCDRSGRILWIPGVLRSAHEPVLPGARRTILLVVADRNA